MCQEFHIFEFACFIVKDIYKLVPNDLSFLFWIRHTSQFIKETFCSVCFDNVQTKLTTKHIHDLVSFPFTKKTVVYKDTNQLIADGFLEKNTNYRRVNTSRKSEKNTFISNFFTDLFDLHLDEVIHSPVTFGTTDIQSKVTQDVITVNRVTNLRVELDSVDFLVWIFNRCKWTVSRSTSADKVSRNFCNSIPVAHQDQLFVWCAGKKSRRFCQIQFRLTIFAVTSITCRNDLPTQFMG